MCDGSVLSRKRVIESQLAFEMELLSNRGPYHTN